MASSVQISQGDFLQYSEAHVSIQTGFDLFLPMDGDGYGGVVRFGGGGRVDLEMQGGSRHHGEGLVFT